MDINRNSDIIVHWKIIKGQLETSVILEVIWFVARFMG